MLETENLVDKHIEVVKEVAVLKFAIDLMNSLPDDTALKVNAFYEKWLKENK